MKNRCLAAVIHGRKAVDAKGRQDVHGEHCSPPDGVFGGSSGVPPQPLRGERPPTLEGVTGQNTTPHLPPSTTPRVDEYPVPGNGYSRPQAVGAKGRRNV